MESGPYGRLVGGANVGRRCNFKVIYFMITICTASIIIAVTIILYYIILYYIIYIYILLCNKGGRNACKEKENGKKLSNNLKLLV